MAKNRKNQSAAIRFGPALKALGLCLLIAGSAVGYVWQKSRIYQLGQQIRQREMRLTRLQNNNQKLDGQLSILRLPVMLDRRARELNLGLAPAQPNQVLRLTEPAPPPPADRTLTHQLAVRPATEMTQ
ncbi:MAG TPA: septum formation initiator family protein [Candidatus Acidoferrum sp.]|nr:septum formation initiator family protein [Candidatus Acidoferrum sp.]